RLQAPSLLMMLIVPPLVTIPMQLAGVTAGVADVVPAIPLVAPQILGVGLGGSLVPLLEVLSQLGAILSNLTRIRSDLPPIGTQFPPVLPDLACLLRRVGPRRGHPEEQPKHQRPHCSNESLHRSLPPGRLRLRDANAVLAGVLDRGPFPGVTRVGCRDRSPVQSRATLRCRHPRTFRVEILNAAYAGHQPTMPVTSATSAITRIAQLATGDATAQATHRSTRPAVILSPRSHPPSLMAMVPYSSEALCGPRTVSDRGSAKWPTTGPTLRTKSGQRIAIASACDPAL